MRYYLNLFSPETLKIFDKSNKSVSGSRISQKSYVERQEIGPGDKFICYVTKIQRFIGVLEIKSYSYVDETPIYSEKDPFVLRFKVEPIVWLPLEKAIPIRENEVWSNLSFTKNLDKESNKWTHMVLRSPRLWPENDGKILENLLLKQFKEQKEYPLTEKELEKIKSHKIRTGEKKEVIVSIPEKNEDLEERKESEKEERKSLAIQAKLAQIGEKLGMKIWIPTSDRSKVLEIWKPFSENILLKELPLVFDETTLNTIKNIDVLWIKRRSIVRAFEVEDTTSIYSGILRMADLLALQPMLDIKIHIVAPTERREAVFKQISRPVFALIGEKPLSEVCSYISYDSILELYDEKNLEHMNDTIIEEYSEFFDE